MAEKIHRMSDQQMAFHCPGCGCAHGVFVDGIGHPVWGWNRSLESPTFTPSIRVQWTKGEPPIHQCCHSFVKDGRIQFLADCTHALAGKTVEIPDWD